jgi:holliday junction ATP-dependent DNA helicase ruvA
MKQSTLRMMIDSAMTLISLMLIGGNYFFPWTGVHEILGVSLFMFWGMHVALNRRWYASLLKGSYRPFRIMQTIVNCGILVCAVFLMISGIMLSQHVFAFLGISSGANFARIAHMLASHWYFLFMSLHIGLHAGMISRHIAAKHQQTAETKTGVSIQSIRLKTIILYTLLAGICTYGLYAFISRGVWRYLVLQQQFFFLDMEKGYVIFFTDYSAIIVLFAACAHYGAKLMGRKNNLR